jgi:hypothetical protein
MDQRLHRGKDEAASRREGRMSVKAIIIWMLAFVATCAMMGAGVHALDLWKQSGWLDATAGCAFVLGFIMWQGWRRR